MSGMKDLFGDVPITFKGPPEQVENIARIHNKIAGAILAYFRHHGIGYQFCVEDLRADIDHMHSGMAPDSAGRIMRDLRQKGLINYTVVNRRASLYRITAV